MHTNAHCSLWPLVRFMAIALPLACSGGTQAPTVVKQPTVPHQRMEFAADSNPQACADWGCRSLTDDERNELLYEIDYFKRAAELAGDADCYDLAWSMYERVTNNMIYVGTHAPSYQPNAIGGWNRNAPQESYVLESRFIAGGQAAWNTSAHETEHNRRGAKPDDIISDTWESSVQSTANRCQSYNAY